MRLLPIFSALLVLSASYATADIFENPKNLKVLPENISPKELSATMRGFSIGTGLRCSGCHVGEENQKLTEYDFESDEKENKKKARKMFEMVNMINNEHLDSIAEDHVQVQCITCHRGVPMPKQLGQVLAEAAKDKGAAGVRETYASLKKEYYGTHSYDFSEFTLSSFARTQGLAGNMPEAKAMLDIMLEENSESFQAHLLYGELSFINGDMVIAKEHLLTALEINPKAVFINRRIEQIEQKIK